MAEHVGTIATPSEEVNGSTAPAEADTTTSTSKPEEATESTNAAASSETPTTSDDKKRKLREDGEDTRDWRVRRNEDNARDHEPNRRETRSSFKPRSKPFKPYSENIKSDYTKQPESDDPDEIRKQVEFYFSDSNLPTDKFLLTQTGGVANKPVPIKTIHSFKRMRHFQPYSAVVAALSASPFLAVTPNEEVSRRVAIAANLLSQDHDVAANVKLVDDATRPRSIYAKGFGEEGPTTQFDIEAFFAPYGPTNAIRLRRTHPEKIFKGSVFVEFDSEDTAKQFLALDPKPKFDGRDLLILSKEEYVLSKAKDVAEGKIAGSAWRGRGGSGGGGRGGGGHRAGRGGRGGRGGGRGNSRGRGRGNSRGDRHGRHDSRGKRDREDDDAGDAADADSAKAKRAKLDDAPAAPSGAATEEKQPEGDSTAT